MTRDGIVCWIAGDPDMEVCWEADSAELPGRTPKPERAAPAKLTIPPLHYSRSEAHALAELRGLSPEGIEVAAVALGCLGFGTVGGFPCWILSDGSRRIAEARRMDGEPFPAIGSLGVRKSHTLKGSCKSWPLGIKLPKLTIPEGFPVVLVEGGPDYLAACDVLFHSKPEFLPVAMLGAGQNIHPDAIPFFRGRDALVLGHPDEAGLTAAKRWAKQLRDAGARPRARQLEGGDLNDLVKLHGAEAVATDLQQYANHA